MATDQQFRVGVVVGGAALVVVMSYVRFCGGVSLPAKSAAPAAPTGTSAQLLDQTTASPVVYADFLAHDAGLAGVRAPTVEDMRKKLAYRVDDARHVIEPGQPPIELAGLRVHLERTGGDLVMQIDNTLASAVAYQVVTQPSVSVQVCNTARPLAFDAMVIAKGQSQTRTECAWRDGMSIAITKVETLELTPLEAYYVRQVPPQLVGIDDRIARGHQTLDGALRCSAVASQAVQSQVDRGEIGWRDLVDFYARHRCETYHFPLNYRAFKSDDELSIPAPGSTGG